jgi:hypothetical protein
MPQLRGNEPILGLNSEVGGHFCGDTPTHKVLIVGYY